MSFWQDLEKPFFVLAPLADVTDASFRRIIAKYSAHERVNGSFGGPDVMFTEFVSADGLMRATPEGKKKLMADLIYSEEERPIVAQLFSSHPEYIEKAAQLCKELGFNGIDINMGCPDRSIEKQGCGSAMIKNPDTAVAVIEAAKRGAGDVPISVKTRLGYNEDELEEWLPVLLSAKPAVVTVHARTRKEMSKVPARWERVKRAVDIRNECGSETLIVGNGDVLDIEDGRLKAKISGADGVMLGRAIFGNPWLFHPSKILPERRVSYQSKLLEEKGEEIILEERLSVMVEHTKLFVKLLPHKNFSVMKKHYKAYVNGFTGASGLRGKLMCTNTSEEVEVIINEFLARKG